MKEHSARVALVTGGARGIGAASAKRLAEDGFAVGIIDLDAGSCGEVVESIRASGGTAMAFGADVSDEDAVVATVASCAEHLGPPVVLVNNAGIVRDNPLFKMSATEWDSVIAVHLRGAYLMSRETQAYMTKARWGRIINMSSISALGNKGQANYAAAKAGLQGFTRTLAIELGKFGITSNCIAPGYIETNMLVDTAGRMGITYQELEAIFLNDVSVGRMGQPEDIAAAVSFFARDEASFVTGQTLYVTGGPAA